MDTVGCWRRARVGAPHYKLRVNLRRRSTARLIRAQIPPLLGAVHRRRGPTHTRPERETAAHSTYRHARCPAALSAGRAVVRRGRSRCWPVVGSIRECPIPAVFASSRRVLAATSASTACPNSVLAPLRKTSVSGSENVPGWVSSKTLVSVTVSLLRWRSGGVEHPHDTPPYPFMPSPTFGLSSYDETIRQ